MAGWRWHKAAGVPASWAGGGRSGRSSPLFFLLVHGDAPRPQRHHQQQPPDDGQGLEEVVLEEVVHGLVGGHGPEGVEVDVDGEEPNHEGEGGQLGLESDRHQDDEGRAHHVLQNLIGRRSGGTDKGRRGRGGDHGLGWNIDRPE